MSSAYVSRINQLDALQLDEAILRILQNRVQDIAKLFTPGTIESWSPEINATVRTLIWIFAFSKGKSTFGQRLLNLTYANLTTKKAILFSFISVMTKYLEDKYMDPNRIMNNDREKMVKKYLEKISNVMHLLSFINLLMFLHRGIQPTILERILNISSQSVTTSKPRNIGYSYITRELLWHGLVELFTIGLPMINFHYLKRYLFKFWSKPNKIIKNSITPTLTIHTKCPYCNESPVLPRHSGCSHIYCYYCMMGHFTAAETFNCYECKIELHKDDMKVYSPSWFN
ncbi:hypothetical protein PV325_002175 [Microctonus aethiopoides]|uniref:RING-type E3 ubiquitin transferase (cysteine targeting) n=1 Tax=Microctonus aethiopoides TaxID=144406 RepID=A0AA39FNJ7_9HYME|nr:hypothetical protein PV325_002175 [Microctonus aethiopoides]KAK0095511.1 hypothetical protein PV326_008153 [Microctonus aethiopoides]KAK0172716.1 hypothetical protein PV328_005996 [Microctonus aethiopoides]